jgi:hypothetical protein
MNIWLEQKSYHSDALTENIELPQFCENSRPTPPRFIKSNGFIAGGSAYNYGILSLSLIGLFNSSLLAVGANDPH